MGEERSTIVLHNLRRESQHSALPMKKTKSRVVADGNVCGGGEGTPKKQRTSVSIVCETEHQELRI